MTAPARAPCDPGVIRAARPGPGVSPRARRWVLVATVLGSSLAFIDGSVANLALPRLQTAFDADIASVQWVVESYALLLSALLLAGGALGDRFGRRRVFALGTGLFGAASIACGLSPGIGPLVAARAVQGVGGALLVPGSLALISAAFDERARGRAIGIWSGFSAMSAGLGPIIGGWLIEQFSWRWAFLINAPLAAAVVAIALLHVPESRDPDAPPRLDWTGALLVTLGLGGVVYGLIESQRDGFAAPRILLALGAGLVLLVLFIGVERRAPHPMLPLSLFRSRAFAGANLLTLFLYAGLSAVFFFLPFALIQVHGYTATRTGAALTPFIAIMFLLSRWSGGLVDRLGGRLPLIAGPLVAAAGFTGMALPGTGGSYWTTFFVPIVVLGLGMAISVAPLTTVVMGAVETRHAGTASGINNAVSRTAGLLAIAALSVAVSATFDRHLDAALPALHLTPAAAQRVAAERSQLAGMSVDPDLDASTREDLRRAIDEAFIAAFRVVALLSALLAVASAAVAWRSIDGRRKTG
ncbi:MAG: MFS transporter [Vicinamibacterales bacterium]